jgi:hypothetical protein
MSNYLESYLVALGFETNQPQLLKFQGSLKIAEGFVASSTSGIVADFLKFEAAGISAFAGVGFGAIGFIDKLAMSDQQMRLFAQRSFMTLQQARSVQTSLDVLGVSLEDVAWDKELHGRFMTLIDDQKQLSAMLGPQYEQQMKDVRNIGFELQRLEVKGEYFGMKFAGDLLKKLGFGDGDLLADLEKLNNFVLKNMPKWSDELSTDAVPVLNDIWKIMGGIKEVTEEAALEFTNLVGVLSGDKAIEGSTFDFHKFAGALGIVSHFLAHILEDFLAVEKVAMRFAPILLGGATGGGVGAVAGGIFGTIAGIPGGPLGMLAGGAAGTATGGAIGTAVGGLGGGGVMLKEEYDRYHSGQPQTGDTSNTTNTSNVTNISNTTNMADQARQMAKYVAGKTGIDPSLIFGQWAFETGGFTNGGSTKLNNLAGIRYPGSTEYRKFDSVEDFAEYYSKLISSKRYASQGIGNARSAHEFAHALKAGSYYESPELQYERGIKYYSESFNQGQAGQGRGDVHIGSIPITITHPGATHEQIQLAVTNGVRDGLGQQTQRNMADLGGIYQ